MMFRLNKKVEYGLMALQWMSHKPATELTTAREVAEQFDIPFDPVARTLQLLHRAGIVEGVQGAQGGYRIGADLSKVSFRRFSDLIERDVGFVNCLGDIGCDRIGRCSLVSPMTKLNDRYRRFLDTISVQDLIDWGPEVGARHVDSCRQSVLL